MNAHQRRLRRRFIKRNYVPSGVIVTEIDTSTVVASTKGLQTLLFSIDTPPVAPQIMSPEAVLAEFAKSESGEQRRNIFSPAFEAPYGTHVDHDEDS